MRRQHTWNDYRGYKYAVNVRQVRGDIVIEDRLWDPKEQGGVSVSTYRLPHYAGYWLREALSAFYPHLPRVPRWWEDCEKDEDHGKKYMFLDPDKDRFVCGACLLNERRKPLLKKDCA